MAQIIQCYEPQSRPPQVSVAVEVGEEFSVYLLVDTANKATLGLRTTIIRKPGESPPADAIFLFAVHTTADRTMLRVRKINRRVPVDLLRPDMQSLVTAGMDFESGSRFEVSLPDTRPVQFGLQYAAQVATGPKTAIGSRGTRRAMETAAAHLWLVPTARAIISSPLSRVVAAMQGAAKKIGISPGILMMFMVAVIPIVVSLLVALWQTRKASAAAEEAAVAQDSLAKSEAGLEAALAAEAACVAERKDVVAELADLEEKRELQAEIALSTPLAQTVSIELGGPRMGTEEALGIDQQYMSDTQDLVILEMQKLRGGAKDAGRCLSHEGVLGHDLPRYSLLWHPDPNLVCPLGYAVVEGGVDRMGSWGISARVAEEFGVSQPKPGDASADVMTDLRSNDRWSSHILANGLRAVQASILAADTENRPPVSPGQAHLWSLAVWDAYNQMPTPAEGVMDQTVDVCVSELIVELARTSKPAVPGEPILPDISLVARGENVPVIHPTAGCPWPSDALLTGAQAAVRAVSHRANLAGDEVFGETGS
jgi:hypothetical protein